MTASESHEPFAELAAGYALLALEPDEERHFRAHLSGCAACQAEVASYEDTLSHLAYAVEPVELPSAIADGIRRGMEATAREPGPPPIDLTTVRSLRPGRAARFAPVWLAVAAGVALVVSLGIWNVALHQQKSQSDVRADRLAAAVSALELGAKQRVSLTDGKGHPVAIAVVRPDDSVSLVIDGIAPNDRRNSTYVLWQKGANGMRALGAFDVGASGIDVVTRFRLAQDVLAGFAVTREPGRRAPTSPGSQPVAAGSVSA